MSLYTVNKLPPLSYSAYTGTGELKRAVAMSLDWAQAHPAPSGKLRPLRLMYESVLATFLTGNEVSDGLLLPADYTRAMSLRHEIQLALDAARMNPNSRDEIRAFFELPPQLIQYIDPVEPDPEYELVMSKPAEGTSWFPNGSNELLLDLRNFGAPINGVLINITYQYLTEDEQVLFTGRTSARSGTNRGWSVGSYSGHALTRIACTCTPFAGVDVVGNFEIAMGALL